MTFTEQPLWISSKSLIQLKEEVQKTSSLDAKVKLLENFETTQEFLFSHPKLSDLFSTFSPEERGIVYSVLAIGQGDRIFQSRSDFEKKDLIPLLNSLSLVEKFYQEIGGIIGYHLTCLELIAKKKGQKNRKSYSSPQAIDISQDIPFTKKKALAGIERLDQIVEIYPLGGAADRLTQNKKGFQIAASLEFLGKSLLERLIDDLRSREYLYSKIFKKEVNIPVILMTSDEKEGSRQILELLEENHWFGKKKEDFFVFSQPLVPTMNNEGNWCVIGPGEILFKPGGHGVIWKLAKETGALKWAKEKGKKKALVRQINNLVAGVDYGLLTFLGIGLEGDKDFGFASCPRLQGASEGVNVIIHCNKGCCLTNIEYCDLEEAFLSEMKEPLLANTNILFVDLSTIEELLSKCPIPGMLVNAKKMKYGNIEEEVIRLESTMQNLADALIESENLPFELQRTYITSHLREKTISTVKKESCSKIPLPQTPQQCFFDLMKNARELFVKHCCFEMPPLKEFTRDFPPFVILYHPALGPMFDIIGQKISGGFLKWGSFLNFQIADLFIEKLYVDGALEILTDSIMGDRDSQKGNIYSSRSGKCILKNVQIKNSGIDREASGNFWKKEIAFSQKCQIFIEEGAEFYAENVVLEEDIQIRVRKGVKLVAYMDGEELRFSETPLKGPSWNWAYHIHSNNHIHLKKVEH